MTMSIAPRGAPQKFDGDVARDRNRAPILAADADLNATNEYATKKDSTKKGWAASPFGRMNQAHIG